MRARQERPQGGKGMISRWMIAGCAVSLAWAAGPGWAGTFEDAVAARETGDLPAALKLFERAAEEGSAAAAMKAAAMHTMGEGTHSDRMEGYKWYRKAADLGNPAGMLTTGDYYNSGGEREDPVEAARWYRKAADRGYKEAQYLIAVFYHRGRGVAQDHKRALNWYRKAADGGEAKGLAGLAELYEDGTGVKQDGALAVELYRKCAGAGLNRCLGALGRVYHEGKVVKKDPVEAYYWYAKAQAAGEEWVKTKLDALTDEMTLQELNEGIRRVQAEREAR